MNVLREIKEIKVAIVEDQKQTREGLAALIGGTRGLRTVGAWASMEEALPRIQRDTPHVLLMDINLPGISGIDGVERVKAVLPAVQILMLTIYDDNDRVFDAICAGACGYLLKDTPPSKLVEALREAHEGGAPMTAEIARKVVTMFQSTTRKKTDHRLSARELEVLKLLADGHTYKTAADTLSVSVDTMRFHTRNIYNKLQVHSKSAALLKAFRTGILR